jgi:chromosome segregation ATPase
MHPLFSAVETLENGVRAQEAATGRARTDTEQAAAALRTEIQSLAASVRQADARLTEQQTRAAAMQSKASETAEALQRVAGQARTTSQQLESVGATHESAIAYLKDAVKQQGFALQKLKIGAAAPGTPLSPRGMRDMPVR